MKLLDLPLELLLMVLCFCDVSTVMLASQTNKTFHELASSRIMWISLVEDLRHRGFVDRLSAADVKAMPTSDLVAVVRRLVVGPASWSPAKATQSRSASHVVLRPAMSPGHPFSHQDVAVLPRGEHVLLNNFRGLECWRVADGVLVWRFESDRVMAFAADVQDGGESANLVICINGSPSNHQGVRIVNLNFSTGVAQPLLETDFVGGACYLVDPVTPRIFGEFAAVHLQGHSFVVFDWRSQAYCKVSEIPGPVRASWGNNITSNLHNSESHRIALDFIPGHFIATSYERIEVYSMAALAGRWVPAEGPVHLDKTETVALGYHMSPVVADSVHPKARHYPTVVVAVQPSPLVRETFRVWIYLHPTRPRYAGCCRGKLKAYDIDDEDVHLVCFRLSLAANRAPAALAGGSESKPTRALPPLAPQLQLRQLMTIRPPGEVTYAGHTLALFGDTTSRGRRWAVSRATPTPNGSWESVGLIELKRRPHIKPVVTTYSGAVAYVARRSLIVQYFE
ncbi:hypothetical protein GGX14DRAFT_573670 [Mycena pura]|uniref:F-box domain-containing protein n=1 Tax=Mycena pura TaxID=153505 RepID=A0AAD6UYA6_9AGAR|nr:hypothetical protein GGX14DRAFT_573670 [Mycena pura]